MGTTPPTTYRTFTGFGEATNEAVLASMGDFRRFCIDPNSYLFRLLGPSKLLELPNELLLQVVSSVEGAGRNQDLRHLALTCRRLRPIAHEALICNPVLTPESIRDYLHIFFQHPEHVAKLSERLHLHATDIHEWLENTALFCEDWGFINSKLYQTCYDIIGNICGPALRLQWALELSGSGESSRSACLAALLLVIPKLEEMSVTDIFVERCALFCRPLVRTRSSTRTGTVFGFNIRSNSGLWDDPAT
jgi:hypothetical protein